MNTSEFQPSASPSAPQTNREGSLPPTSSTPPVARISVQSASQVQHPAARISRAPRRLRSPREVEAAVASRNPAWVPHLIRAIAARDAALRRAAHQALPHFGEAAMIGLLRAAAHAHGEVREEAVGCLGEWGDARALQPLLLALRNDRRERNARTVLRFLSAALLSFGARSEREMETLWSQVECRTQVRVRACGALGKLRDVRAVVPLIGLARDQDHSVAYAARLALGQLLPLVAALQPEQTRVLGSEGVPALLSLLHDLDEPLVRLVLNAMQAVGDARALPEIFQLASDRSRPFVQQEAVKLLALLQARAVQEQARTSLLRGSAPPAPLARDALLRPAYAAPPEPADELLRGSST